MLYRLPADAIRRVSARLRPKILLPAWRPRRNRVAYLHRWLPATEGQVLAAQRSPDRIGLFWGVDSQSALAPRVLAELGDHLTVK